MKVRATSHGYYGNVSRVPGEVFTLKAFKTHRLVTKDKSGKPVVTKSDKLIVVTPEEQFSENWMEKVDASVPVQKVKKPKGRSENFPPEQSPNARDVSQPREREVESQDPDEEIEDADGDARNNNDESVI